MSDEALDKSSRMAPRDDPGAMFEDSVTDGNLLIRLRLLLVASTEFDTKLLKGISSLVTLDLM